MTAQPITPTAGHRYIPPGKRQYYWVITIADYTAPTRTELDAGNDLSAEVASISGFSVTSESVDAPDLASRYTSKVPGMTTAEDSAINLYISDTGEDARTLLVRDTDGYVVVFPSGDDDGASGTKLMGVFPATVSSQALQPEFDSPAQVAVSFTITDEPAQNVLIP